ncbi:hypothetical protein MAJ_02375, partial [Metarhizium majus ARSEF 297]
MVSVAEKDGPASQDNTPPTKLPMDFPIWTRAEDDEKDRNAGLSILQRRSRKWNRDHGVAHAADPAQRPSRLDSRGLFKDIAQPVVSGIFDALSFQDGPESSDDEKSPKSKGLKPPPAPIQTQPPPRLPALKSPESPKSPKSYKSPTSPANPTPPPPSAYPTPSPLPSPPPPVSNPGNPKPTEAVVNPIQPPPGNTWPDSSYGPTMRFSTLTPSASTTRRTTTTNAPPPSLAPIVTLPVPLSTGPRKGVNPLPTLDAVSTISTSMSPTSPASPASPTSSSSLYPTPISDSGKAYHPDHDKGNIHPKVEMALVALGSIGSSIIVAFIGWLIWRCHKRRRAIDSSRTWKPHFPKNMPTDKPKLLVTNALARIPILKNRMDDRRRRWTNLDQADLGPFSEKAYVAQAQSMATQQPPLSGVSVQTDFVRTSTHADVPQNGATLHVPKVSISSIEPQAGSTLRSGTQLPNTRMSDISSLSSGFGDGQFMIDTLSSGTNSANNTASETTVKAPLPVARRESVGALSQRRDTVYTEASEDTPARFRSVNSWVRQQTGRVTRATQRNQASDAPPVPALPPEQDFGLMMPDGEEPRRADSVTGYGVAR